MNKIATRPKLPTLAERVQSALQNGAAVPDLAARAANGKSQQAQAQQALVLDVSGSMAEDVEPGRSKIDALRDLAAGFPHTRKFVFADGCQEVLHIPRPGGSTNMPEAFRHIKAKGIRHAVLITDGEPQDEDGSLREARGLKLDIFYVGPPPKPDFLERLAKITGGTFQASTLKQDATRQIATRVRGLLASG